MTLLRERAGIGKKKRSRIEIEKEEERILSGKVPVPGTEAASAAAAAASETTIDLSGAKHINLFEDIEQVSLFLVLLSIINRVIMIAIDRCLTRILAGSPSTEEERKRGTGRRTRTFREGSESLVLLLLLERFRQRPQHIGPNEARGRGGASEGDP
jgi:hypothetical protein